MLDRRVREGAEKFEEAIASFEKSIKRFPTQVESYSRLATVWRRTNQPAKADKIISDMVQSNQKSPSAFLARARYRNEFGVEAADEDITQAHKLGPDDLEAILASTNLALKQAKPDLDTARRDLEHGMEIAPTAAACTRSWLDPSLAATNRPGSAVACLRKGLAALADADEDLFDLKVALADSLIGDGHSQEAVKLLAALREEANKNNIEPPTLDLLDARIKMSETRGPKPSTSWIPFA